MAGSIVGAAALGQDSGGPQSPPNSTPNSAAAAAVQSIRNQRFTDALRVVDEALVPLIAAKGGGDSDVLTLLILKGQASYGLGRPQDAIEALSPFVRSLEAPAPLVGASADWSAVNVAADSFMALDRWNDALACLVRARSLVAADTAAAPRTRAINTAMTLGKLGTARARLGDWDGARKAFEEQIAALVGEPGEGGAYLAAAHNGLGLVADNDGDPAGAANHYAIAARIYEESFGLDHPYTKRALTTLARVQTKVGDTQEADRITARLATVDAVPMVISPTLMPAPSPIPVPPPATRMPLLTTPVIAAAGAAILLVALTASGFLGRRRAAAAFDAGTGKAIDGEPPRSTVPSTPD